MMTTTQPITTVTIALTETLRIAQNIFRQQRELRFIENELRPVADKEPTVVVTSKLPDSSLKHTLIRLRLPGWPVPAAAVLDTRIDYLREHIKHDQERLFNSVLEQCGSADITRWLLRDLNAEENLNEAPKVEVRLTRAENASLHRADADGTVKFYGTHPLLGLPEEKVYG